MARSRALPAGVVRLPAPTDPEAGRLAVAPGHRAPGPRTAVASGRQPISWPAAAGLTAYAIVTTSRRTRCRQMAALQLLLLTRLNDSSFGVPLVVVAEDVCPQIRGHRHELVRGIGGEVALDHDLPICPNK